MIPPPPPPPLRQPAALDAPALVALVVGALLVVVLGYRDALAVLGYGAAAAVVDLLGRVAALLS
jgi:hypothetical protein